MRCLCIDHDFSYLCLLSTQPMWSGIISCQMMIGGVTQSVSRRNHLLVSGDVMSVDSTSPSFFFTILAREDQLPLASIHPGMPCHTLGKSLVAHFLCTVVTKSEGSDELSKWGVQNYVWHKVEQICVA